MKKKISLLLIIVLLLTLYGCQGKSQVATPTSQEKQMNTADIYLYGEEHGKKSLLEKELELWKTYYSEQGMRHLFVEYPYYTAEFLNLWLQEEDDAILDKIYQDWQGTQAYNSDVVDFFKAIKKECPETIFHGTDVGHQYNSTGLRYLAYLEEHNMKDSEAYKRGSTAIEQGKKYYAAYDDVYRENQMTENFILAFNQLGNEKVMGIYGSAHTNTENSYAESKVKIMGEQLKAYYGDAVHSEDLSLLAKANEPIRIEELTINGKKYKASYFGKEDLTGFKDFTFREFWRLEDAYEDFKDAKPNNDVLPYDNYPMQIQKDQVFILDIGTKDGKVQRNIYRSDGLMWENRPTTTGIVM